MRVQASVVFSVIARLDRAIYSMTVIPWFGGNGMDSRVKPGNDGECGHCPAKTTAVVAPAKVGFASMLVTYDLAQGHFATLQLVSWGALVGCL